MTWAGVRPLPGQNTARGPCRRACRTMRPLRLLAGDRPPSRAAAPAQRTGDGPACPALSCQSRLRTGTPGRWSTRSPSPHGTVVAPSGRLLSWRRATGRDVHVLFQDTSVPTASIVVFQTYKPTMLAADDAEERVDRYGIRVYWQYVHRARVHDRTGRCCGFSLLSTPSCRTPCAGACRNCSCVARTRMQHVAKAATQRPAAAAARRAPRRMKRRRVSAP